MFHNLFYDILVAVDTTLLSYRCRRTLSILLDETIDKLFIFESSIIYIDSLVKPAYLMAMTIFYIHSVMTVIKEVRSVEQKSQFYCLICLVIKMHY